MLLFILITAFVLVSGWFFYVLTKAKRKKVKRILCGYHAYTLLEIGELALIDKERCSVCKGRKAC